MTNHCSLSAIVFSKNSVLWGKKATDSAGNPTNQSRPFPGEDPRTPVAEELYANLLCVRQHTEKD